MDDGFSQPHSSRSKVSARNRNLKKTVNQTPGGRKIIVLNGGQTLRMQASSSSQDVGKQKSEELVPLFRKQMRPIPKSRRCRGRKSGALLKHKPTSSFRSFKSKFQSSEHTLDNVLVSQSVIVEKMEDVGVSLEDDIDFTMMDNCTLDINADHLMGEITSNSSMLPQDMLGKTDDSEFDSQFSSAGTDNQMDSIFVKAADLSDGDDTDLDPPSQMLLNEPECHLMVKVRKLVFLECFF